MNEDSLRENHYAQMMLDYGCVEIQDEFGDYLMDEVGHAWKERFVIARIYDITAYEARSDITDPEVTSEGFYLDLMMTRGSDPAESKSTLGADHLAVKEVKPRSSQVAGRHAVIAFTEEEEDPRIVWCGHLGQGLGTRRCGLGGLSQHLYILYTQEGSLPYDEQDDDCDSMLCKCFVHHDCVNGGRSVRTISGTLENRVRAAISCTYLLLPARSQLWSVSSDAVYHPELRIR